MLTPCSFPSYPLPWIHFSCLLLGILQSTKGPSRIFYTTIIIFWSAAITINIYTPSAGYFDLKFVGAWSQKLGSRDIIHSVTWMLTHNLAQPAQHITNRLSKVEGRNKDLRSTSKIARRRRRPHIDHRRAHVDIEGCTSISEGRRTKRTHRILSTLALHNLRRRRALFDDRCAVFDVDVRSSMSTWDLCVDLRPSMIDFVMLCGLG